jgi:hypothetical protein
MAGAGILTFRDVTTGQTSTIGASGSDTWRRESAGWRLIDSITDELVQIAKAARR